MLITLWINNQKLQAQVSPDLLLVDFLREQGYLGVKRGCDTANCGLCTVWLDEKPILSCATLAVMATGKRVTTIEGVQEQATAFGEFMAKEGAEQCGFCSPGFILSVLAMEKELTNPSDQEIQHYLAGNLCRCTGYMGQLRAIKKYLQLKKGV